MPRRNQTEYGGPKRPRLDRTSPELFADRGDQISDLVGWTGAGDVRLADDAHQLLTVDHRQPSNLVVLHGLDREVDAVVGPDRDGLFADELAQAHAGRIFALGKHPNDEIAIGHHATQVPVGFTDRD